ncbi:MAG: alpha/beta fold hydrolase [Marinobacter sp.]|nr:alpha/beta fold hydrolase [Marinobacter sp.]
MPDNKKLTTLITDVAEKRAEFTELVETLAPELSTDNDLPTELALELSTALHEVEQSVGKDDPLYRLVNEQSAPALALNEAGQVIALNIGAVQLFRLQSGEGTTSLGIAAEEFHAFKERLATVPGPTLIKVFRSGAPGESLPLILVGTYHARLRAFVLTALQQHWPESIDRAFADLFRLSVSERRILALLSRGMGTDEIAAERGSTVATVRQQIKAVLQKLGATSQVQAATLAAAASTAVDAANSRGELLNPNFDDHPLSIHEFQREGRRIGWRRFGKPGGIPVLLLHGPSFGAGDFPKERSLAETFNLDIIAIERPGYGRTDSPDGNDDPLTCQCQDVMALLAQQAVGHVYIIAHEVALITALALARRPHLKVKGIVSVSAAPPFRELQQINAMPAHQAIFIQSARHAPWLARLMIRLLMVRMRKLGPEKWTDVVFESVKVDETVIRSPELKQGVIAAYGFYVNQMGAGYLNDLKVMIKDWGDLLRRIPVPIVMLHGDSNASTPVEHLEVFRQIAPELPIDVIPNEGLTLAVSRPHLIYEAVLKMDAPLAEIPATA